MGENIGAANGLEVGVASGQVVDLAGSYFHSEQYSLLRQRLEPILKHAKGEDKEKGVAGKVGRKLGGSHLYTTSMPWQV